MKNLDLEKIIIIVSLILMPVAGGWIYMQMQEIKEADSALASVDSQIVKIYSLHETIQRTKDELSKSGTPENAPLYFQNRGIDAQGESGAIIKMANITVNTGTMTNVRQGNRTIGKDIPVTIRFRGSDKGNSKMALPRSFINAFIHNSEARSPLWKLRSLKMSNVALGTKRNAGPPKEQEIPDEWYIDQLIFARRKPVAPDIKKAKRPRN